MVQIKHYTAKRAGRLDCGHSIKPGQPLQVTSLFTCPQEEAASLSFLMACFGIIAPQRPAETATEAGRKKQPAQQDPPPTPPEKA